MNHGSIAFQALARLVIIMLCASTLLTSCQNQAGKGEMNAPTTTMTNPPASPTKTPAPSAVMPTSTTQVRATASALPTMTVTPTAEPNVVVVDAAQNLGAVSSLVYGSNTGPWQSITKADLSLIQNAGFTIFRFPGGSYVDENAPSHSALDEFIAMCRQVNAEPMVQVKLVNSKPETAAAMVKYANVDKGYGIKYWSIGNEPSLYWGQRNIAHYDTVAFNREWRAFALAMKAVDPSIQLLGPETHQYTGFPGEQIVDIHYKDWMGEFLLANGDLVDIVSFHRYPFGNFDPFPDELLRNSEEWDRIIPNLRQLIQATTGREIPIAVTEVNSNWSNRARAETTPDTLLNAIWWADALGRMIRQGVEIVNQFAIDGHGGWALLGTQNPRPSYYVYLIYKEFGNQLVFSSSGIKNISAYSAIRSDGALSLILVNRNNEPTQTRVEVRNFAVSGQARQMVLDTEHMAEELPADKVSNPFTIELPALSVNLFIFPGK